MSTLRPAITDTSANFEGSLAENSLIRRKKTTKNKQKVKHFIMEKTKIHKRMRVMKILIKSYLLMKFIHNYLCAIMPFVGCFELKHLFPSIII